MSDPSPPDIEATAFNHVLTKILKVEPSDLLYIVMKENFHSLHDVCVLDGRTIHATVCLETRNKRLPVWIQTTLKQLVVYYEHWKAQDRSRTNAPSLPDEEWLALKAEDWVAFKDLPSTRKAVQDMTPDHMTSVKQHFSSFSTQASSLCHSKNDDCVEEDVQGVLNVIEMNSRPLTAEKDFSTSRTLIPTSRCRPMSRKSSLSLLPPRWKTVYRPAAPLVSVKMLTISQFVSIILTMRTTLATRLPVSTP